MIVATLVLSFLLSFLPLVIGTLSYRYAANFYSRGILTLSSVSFLLGLAQFSLILGTSYRLFPTDRMLQAAHAIQYISIGGGAVMIVAGLLWVGYFRTLMQRDRSLRRTPSVAESLTRQEPKPSPIIEPIAVAAQAEDLPKEPAPAPKPRKRRPAPAPAIPIEDDWFAAELGLPAVKLSAVTTTRRSRKMVARSRTPKAQSGA